MKPAQLYEDKYLQILWDDQTRIISIDWKAATSAMTDEDFKMELTLFAKQVEERGAQNSHRCKQISSPTGRGDWRVAIKEYLHPLQCCRRAAFRVSPFEGFADFADGKSVRGSTVSNSIVQKRRARYDLVHGPHLSLLDTTP